MARAESNHADAEPTLSRLLGPGELVAVPVESQHAKGTGSEESHHRPPPRVVDPSLRFFDHRAIGRRLDGGELLSLSGQAINDLESRVFPEHPQHLPLITRPHVEN